MRQSRAGKRQGRKTIHRNETIECHLAARPVLLGIVLIGHHLLGHCVIGHALHHFSAISRSGHFNLRNSCLCCDLHKQAEAEADQSRAQG